MVGIGGGNAAAVVEGIQAVASNSNAQEAVEVLVSLGFNRSDAAAVVGAMDKTLSVDAMIRNGLKQLSSQI